MDFLGKIGGAEVLGGNLNFISDSISSDEEMQRQAEHLSETGKNTTILQPE